MVIFWQGSENNTMNGHIFNKWCWENCISTGKRIKLDTLIWKEIKLKIQDSKQKHAHNIHSYIHTQN